MATDLAEEQRRVAQRCGTEAAEDWGLTPHHDTTTRHDTTRRHDMTCVPKYLPNPRNPRIPTFH